MLTIWVQSIMVSAIARKSSGSTRGTKFLKSRNDLMKKALATVWTRFKNEFPGEITKDEELAADMVILLRNQQAHCYISSGKELALFLVRGSSQRRIARLESAGWIEVPDNVSSDPAMTVLREGDKVWVDRNTSMILGFATNTVLRLAGQHGIKDVEVC